MSDLPSGYFSDLTFDNSPCRRYTAKFCSFLIQVTSCLECHPPDGPPAAMSAVGFYSLSYLGVAFFVETLSKAV